MGVLSLLVNFGYIVLPLLIKQTGIEHRVWQEIPMRLLGAFNWLLIWSGALQFLFNESPPAFRTMILAMFFVVYGLSIALETAIFHLLQILYAHLDMEWAPYFAIVQCVFCFALFSSAPSPSSSEMEDLLLNALVRYRRNASILFCSLFFCSFTFVFRDGRSPLKCSCQI